MCMVAVVHVVGPSTGLTNQVSEVTVVGPYRVLQIMGLILDQFDMFLQVNYCL